MKKTYQKPTTEVVNVELQQFCETSTDIGIGGNYGGGDVQSRDDDFDLWDALK